ncbi:predicted protein [Histoplasma mississippiense (nom. inval.)]|uniref:predicted protein n=1 Tax=Ajellomyces capsulatus (strain NAm1 / WU24) TaxID=2059318 RepID=UPI000157C470|nr:predicted protein [Histoplasma mississippiense (nom. inval.)]EDN08205.1 predicted protein [Histoplasma mississippiense (nom. inval.)]
MRDTKGARENIQRVKPVVRPQAEAGGRGKKGARAKRFGKEARQQAVGGRKGGSGKGKGEGRRGGARRGGKKLSRWKIDDVTQSGELEGRQTRTGDGRFDAANGRGRRQHARPVREAARGRGHYELIKERKRKEIRRKEAAPQWSTERKNIEGYAEESLELRDYASAEREAEGVGCMIEMS